MSTPIGIVELLVGKLAPYFVLGMAAMALSVGAAVFVFHVPFRGSCRRAGRRIGGLSPLHAGLWAAHLDGRA